MTRRASVTHSRYAFRCPETVDGLPAEREITIQKAIMTTANKITIVRILLVPLFIVHLLYYVNGGRVHHRFLGIFAFALAAISDGVDGFIARHYNQRSERGAILDPLADKILLVSGVVLLSLNNSPYLER